MRKGGVGHCAALVAPGHAALWSARQNRRDHLRDLFDHLTTTLTHRLTQVALAYAAVGFLLHRAAWIIRWTWRLPGWTDGILLVVLAVGFLPVMLMTARTSGSVGANEVGEGVDVELGDVAGAGDRVVPAARQDHRSEVA